MRLLSVVGFGSFVIASLWLGLRLLLLARRTREVPELSVGLALFLGGGVGYLLMMLVLGVGALSGRAAFFALFAGTTCTALGATCLAVGTYRIFHRGDRVWSLLVAAIALPLAITLLGHALDFDRVPAAPWIFWTSTLAGLASYLWSAWQSLACHQQMRRRARIGLADASTTQRFLFWGLAVSAVVAMHGVSMLSRTLVGSAPPPDWLMGITSLLGIATAAGLWLAFFPRSRSRAGPALA